MPSKRNSQRPWQKRGYAIGLGEGIELAISRGHQSASFIAIWLKNEAGTFTGPTARQVQSARSELRLQGLVSYTRHAGWQTAPAYAGAAALRTSNRK